MAGNAIAEMNKKNIELAVEFNFLVNRSLSRELSRDEANCLREVATFIEINWALEEIKARERF